MEEDEPADSEEDAGEADKCFFEKEIENFVNRKAAAVQNVKNVHALTWGQCTEVPRTRTDASPDCDKFKISHNSMELSKETKGTCFQFEEQKCICHRAARRHW